jgi:uncharacterized protein YoxC
MATMYLAMWFQDSDAASTRRLAFYLILLIAVAIAGMAIVLLIFALKAFKMIKELSATAEEVKGRLLPLLEEATVLAKSGRELLVDAAPKVKIITENLVKTSDTLAQTSQLAKAAMQQIDTTVIDANLRTQRQIARVDGMVSAALNTATEVVESINNGIRVPAQKIAVIATQAKYVAEGLLAKFKAATENSPFGRRKTPVDTVPEPPVY